MEYEKTYVHRFFFCYPFLGTYVVTYTPSNECSDQCKYRSGHLLGKRYTSTSMKGKTKIFYIDFHIPKYCKF